MHEGNTEEKRPPDHNWRQHSVQLDQAEGVIACLEALELWKPSGEVVPFP
jgi:hypothetical protein